jgi:hypothetical protein
MASKPNNDGAPKSENDFRISNGPIIRLGEDKGRFDFGDVVELPRVYGEKILFAITRDPRTIFTYCNIDWQSIFESAAVEPMSGNCYLTVSQPRENYRVEIGYYQPKDVWNSVATSEAVTMPPDSVAEKVDVDLATIPFHLSFQRLIDLFRAANGDALTEIISRLQRRAVTDEDRDLLSPEEWEILRAMNLSLDDIGLARRAFTERAGSEKLRKRAESLLGFGSSSPSRGFGGSSWS